MTTEIAPIHQSVQDSIRNFSEIPTTELKALLTEDIGDVAKRLVRMASIVAVLESRGEDLSALKIGMIDHLRKIASGQLIPEIVVRYSGRAAILNVACNLPLVDQVRLAAGEGIPVIVPSGGGYDTRMIDPAYLRPEQVRQVFDRDRIRSETEQIAILENAKIRPSKVKKDAKIGKLHPDKNRGGIVFGKSFFPIADILASVRLLQRDQDDSGDRSESVTFTLSEEELAKLNRIVSERGSKSRSVVVRDALITLGLI